MHFQSELCHIEETRIIVRVSAWNGEDNFGSTLSEGSTVEIAEDKGIKRLLERLEIKKDDPLLKTNEEINSQNNITISAKEMPTVAKSINTRIETIDSRAEPEEWSKELAEIEIEIKRLSWDRDQENNFLKEKFFIHGRNRITKYSDLMDYLSMLKNIDSPTNMTRADKTNNEKTRIMEEIDLNIMKLGWSMSKAREFLFDNMKATSRQGLNLTELNQFNQLLCLQLNTE